MSLITLFAFLQYQINELNHVAFTTLNKREHAICTLLNRQKLPLFILNNVPKNSLFHKKGMHVRTVALGIIHYEFAVLYGTDKKL